MAGAPTADWTGDLRLWWNGGLEQTGFFDEAGQFGHGMDAEFSGDAGAVEFDRAFIYPEIDGDLFVELPTDNVAEDFEFASAQRRESFCECVLSVTSFALASSTFKRSSNGCKQSFLRRELVQKILCSGPHGSDGRRNVTLCCKKHEWQRVLAGRKLLLKLQAVHSGHLEVGEDATPGIGSELTEKLGGRRECRHSIA